MTIEDLGWDKDREPSSQPLCGRRSKYIEQGDSFMDRVGKMIFNFIHGYDNELLWL